MVDYLIPVDYHHDMPLHTLFMITKYISTILSLLLIAILVVVGLAGANTPQMFNNDKDLQTSVLTGFWTGIFALIFLGLSSIAQKIFKREGQHYNSLVNLGTQLNEMIGVIKDNIYIIPTFRDSIVKGNIFWGNLRQVYIDKSHYENLFDIDLINEIFTFFYQIRKLNDDMENLQSGYNDLKNAYIQKQITVEHYVENANLISKHLEIIEVFLEDLTSQLLELLARVRIQIRKDKPLVSSILEKLIYTSGNSILVRELKSETSQLQEELDMSSSKSKKEIETILKKKARSR